MGVFQNNLMGAAAAAASAGGGGFYTHQIANSIRMPAPSSTASSNSKLKRTVGTPDSNVHWTLNFWIKRAVIGGKNPLGFDRSLVFFTPLSGTSGSTLMEFKFSGPTAGNSAGDSLMIVNTSSNAIVLSTDNVYRDTSAWYNIHVQADADNGTASEKLKIFVNGTETSYNTDNRGSYSSFPGIASGRWTIGDFYDGSYPIQGSFAQFCYIDGTTYAASDFGETKNGVWIPKDPSGLTFGSEGFYLDFASSSDLGNDVSGNNNDWAVANIASHDKTLDSPTFGSEGSANFPLWSPLIKGAVNLSENNTRFDGTTGTRTAMTSWAIPPGTKYYVECLTTIASGYGMTFGLANPDIDMTGYNEEDSSFNGFLYVGYSGAGWKTNAIENGSRQGFSGDLPTNSTGVMAITIDRVANEVKCYLNNSLITSGTISISATEEYRIIVFFGGGNNSAMNMNINAGHDSTGAGLYSAGSATDENGFGSFQYAPPTGFLALCSANLPTADEVDPAQTDDDFPQKLFNTKLYTGTGSSNALTGLGFQPDWTWIKERGGANDHKLTDSTRGVTKSIESNTNAVEATDSNGLTAFGTDGFTVGSDAVYNNSSDTYASWNWRANGGTTSTNTQGSVDSTVQADPSGAFSVVTWTGGGGNATLGHGLSGAPTFMVAKSRTTGAPVMDWPAFHQNMNGGAYPANESRMYWDSAGDYSTGALWQNDNNSATLFGVTYNINDSGKNYVAYCFTDVEGYCKAGWYVGNGDADGPFSYTGFRPAWTMIKRADGTGNWLLFDDKTSPFNQMSNILEVNTADSTYNNVLHIDFLSNGFKIRNGTYGETNASGGTYIYLAFAENPFKYATAR